MKEKINREIFTRIVIISGSPGTGKTTISRILAEKSTYDKAVHIELDDFWQFIRKGYIHPWLDESGDQNEVVVESFLASAKIYCESGYEVFADGTVGPWFLEPWIKVAKKGIDVRYIVLRPNEEATIKRAAERHQREFFPLDTEIIKNVWGSFADIDIYESHVLDTTGQTIDESVAIIQKMLYKGFFRIA